MARVLAILTLLLVCLTLPARADDSLKVHQTFSGFAHLPLAAPGAPGAIPPPRVLRSPTELETFIATIPTREISMTNPSPPSKDPLLKKPALDFDRYMAIVVFTDFIYSTPTVESVVRKGSDIVVKVRREQPPDARGMQYPLGVGRYQLLLVPKTPGKVVEAR